MLITSLYASNKCSQQIHVICGAQKQKKKKKRFKKQMNQVAPVLQTPKFLPPANLSNTSLLVNAFLRGLKKKKIIFI